MVGSSIWSLRRQLERLALRDGASSRASTLPTMANGWRLPEVLLKNEGYPSDGIESTIAAAGGTSEKAMELLRFEDFELDRNAYQLRRGGRVVRLERIPLELLFLLADRRGQLVSREEILERIWGKGVFIDVDASINAAVRKARRALNDDAEAPRFLVTVPTKGYRFVAPVREAGAGLSKVRRTQGSFRGTRARAGRVARRP